MRLNTGAEEEGNRNDKENRYNNRVQNILDYKFAGHTHVLRHHNHHGNKS